MNAGGRDRRENTANKERIGTEDAGLTLDFIIIIIYINI